MNSDSCAHIEIAAKIVFDLTARTGLRSDRVIDYASVCRSKRDFTPLGFNHFMRWPLRAATVCILNSFGSSSAWRTALMQTFRRLCKRPKNARF